MITVMQIRIHHFASVVKLKPYPGSITHTSPATTKHPTIIVTITGTVFQYANSFREMYMSFCARRCFQSRPASEAGNL